MAGFAELNGLPCEDANELAAWCRRCSPTLPTDWLPEANRYICPVGFTPGVGGAIVRKSILDKIDLTKKLTFRLGDDTGRNRLFPNFRATGNPRCINPGTHDPAFLVRLADRRIDLLAATARRFQWRWGPTDPDPVHGTDTGDSWAAVVEDVWDQLGIADDFPGLPTAVPSGSAAAVDRLDLHGFRAADALEDVLAAVGCGLTYDPIEDEYDFVYFPAAGDAALTVFGDARADLAYDESPYVPAKPSPVPAYVGVVFPVWPASRFGHQPRRVYVVKVASSGVTFPGGTEVTGVVYLQDFMVARVDQRFNVLNASVLATRASQVARIFYDRLSATAPQWPIKRIYTGIVDHDDAKPGGSFDVVGWSVGEGGPQTYMARSALVAVAELYAGTVTTGIKSNLSPTPLLDSDGVARRAGGLPAEVERERSTWGWGFDVSGTPLSGAGLGPLYRRGSALRQGDWASIGTGGRTDQRGRLWRNWEDLGPDDMTRAIRIKGPADPDADDRYPCRILQQVGLPAEWPEEEWAWAIGMAGETLEQDVEYLAHAGTDLFDGKITWATFCCLKGSKSGSGSHSSGTDQAPDCCDLGDEVVTELTGSGGACPACLSTPLVVVMPREGGSGRFTGSNCCTTGGCTFCFEATLQCYPCANPPLDPDCEDPDCSGETFFYCYTWTVTATGCSVPSASGSVQWAGSSIDCSNFAKSFTISVGGCTLTVSLSYGITKSDCCPYPNSRPKPLPLRLWVLLGTGAVSYGTYPIDFGPPPAGASQSPGVAMPNFGWWGSGAFTDCGKTIWFGVAYPSCHFMLSYDGVHYYDKSAGGTLQCNPFATTGLSVPYNTLEIWPSVTQFWLGYSGCEGSAVAMLFTVEEL